MSQIQTRQSRAAVKRALSVDDINSVSLPQTTSTENLNSSTGKSSTGRTVVNSKRRRKQKRQVQSEDSQQPKLPHVVGESVDINIETEMESELDGELSVLSQSTVTSYIDEINSLKTQVKSLQTKLDYVLSFLGIVNDEPAQPDKHRTITDLSATQPGIVPNVVVDNNQPQQRKSYTDAVQKPSLSLPFRNAVISAVYADFEDKDRRAKNIVISGLPVSSTTDKVSVEILCQKEFSFIPRIIKCRRLGQSVQGRIQPILVTFHTTADAEFLISNAKSLRQSGDPTVKSSVYINPDLTKAEALAAYDRRCRRRRAIATQRNLSTESSTDGNQLQATHLDSSRSVSVSNDDEVIHSISVLNTREPSSQLTVASSHKMQPNQNGLDGTSETVSESEHLDPATPLFVPSTITADVHRSAE